MSDQAVVTVGIDEVGRGCVLGPLVQAAAFRNGPYVNPDVKDSKLITSEKKRNKIAEDIRQYMMCLPLFTHAWQINLVGIEDAVRHGVLLLAKMISAQAHIRFPGARVEVIVDGDDFATDPQYCADGDYWLKSIVKADTSVFEVSAASIYAKVVRDNWVHELVQENPSFWRNYDLDNNKGYGTQAHAFAIIEHGGTAQHRTKATETLKATYQTRYDRLHCNHTPHTVKRQKGTL